MGVQEIKSQDEFHTIINSGKVVFIDFYADWCGPCQFISPSFEKLAEDNASHDGVEFYKVDVDGAPGITKEAGIRAMPTFLAYRDGAVVDSLRGANLQALTALVNGKL